MNHPGAQPIDSPSDNEDAFTDSGSCFDLAPRFHPDAPLLSTEVDHILVQVVVAGNRDGRKAHEIPFQAVKIFYPFAETIAKIVAEAERQADEQWQQMCGQS